MRFWDTSALAPLFIEEQRSAEMQRIADEDDDVHIWWGTPVECASVIARIRREGRMTASNEVLAQKTLADLLLAAQEVAPTHAVRERAARLVRTHPLRAADALQLASALVWARERPQGMHFVSLDGRLRAAAQREGFSLVPEVLS